VNHFSPFWSWRNWAWWTRHCAPVQRWLEPKLCSKRMMSHH